MGRTPVIGTVFNDFVPWQQILVYIEAIVRVYNLHGRRDNLYKARIKILVKAEGQRFVDDVNAEFAALLADDARPARTSSRRPNSTAWPPASRAAGAAAGFQPAADTDAPPAYRRWLERNVHAHKVPGYRAVTLSLKRAGLPPGDVTPSRWTAPRRWPTTSAAANCVSRTTRTCCCPGCTKPSCVRCGRPPRRAALPRPTSGC
jgi:sulfite reductase (NADPH) hemoprotein beta-component